MAHKQLFVMAMLIVFASLAAAQTVGGACGANTVPNGPNGCGTACPTTCANRNSPRRPCILVCITSGCSCAEGYIRYSDLNSTCIPPSQCPC